MRAMLEQVADGAEPERRQPLPESSPNTGERFDPVREPFRPRKTSRTRPSVRRRRLGKSSRKLLFQGAAEYRTDWG
jgi:hypothetical protein